MHVIWEFPIPWQSCCDHIVTLQDTCYSLTSSMVLIVILFKEHSRLNNGHSSENE